MVFLDNIPAVVRILIVFVLVLAAIRKKISLGNAFLGGAVLLGLIFGLYPTAVVKSAFFSLVHPKTLSLSVVVTLILVLSYSLEAAGQMERLLDHFKGVVRHAGTNLVIFPAIIGLLPMPGGAIFSAPMVKNLGERYHLDGPQLSYVNYWFRHIWEYWWPLYPGVLLTTAISGLDLWTFVVCLFPMTLVAVTAGYLPLGGAIRVTDTNGSFGKRAPVTPFLRELTPILIAIVLGIGLGILLTGPFKRMGLSIAKETGLIVALGVSIFWVWHQNRVSRKKRLEIIFN